MLNPKPPECAYPSARSVPCPFCGARRKMAVLRVLERPLASRPSTGPPPFAESPTLSVTSGGAGRSTKGAPRTKTCRKGLSSRPTPPGRRVPGATHGSRGEVRRETGSPGGRRSTSARPRDAPPRAFSPVGEGQSPGGGPVPDPLRAILSVPGAGTSTTHSPIGSKSFATNTGLP